MIARLTAPTRKHLDYFIRRINDAIIHGTIAIVRTVAIMIYKTNSKKFSVKGRGEYMSKSDFIIQFYMDPDKCRGFFFNIKWPEGYA